jgi:hypothetical protein
MANGLRPFTERREDGSNRTAKDSTGYRGGSQVEQRARQGPVNQPG